MPNRLTRVPEGPVPTLPLAGRALLPLADAFMILMVSRPASGSLRQTWVTPATLALAASVAALSALLALALATRTHGGALAVAGLVLLAGIFIGSGAVTLVGILQRAQAQG